MARLVWAAFLWCGGSCGEKKSVRQFSHSWRFYFQAFSGSVVLPAAGHDYNSDWTPLLAGLSPTGMAASLQLASPHWPGARWILFHHIADGIQECVWTIGPALPNVSRAGNRRRRGARPAA